MWGNWRQSWSPVFILCSPSAVFIALTVADLGEGPGGGGGGRALPLFLDQTDAPRSEKFFFFRPPPYLRVWIIASPPPPPLVLSEGSAPD